MVIGIIGAGISGLIAGKRLAKAGHDVTLIEKSRSLGGRLATVEIDDSFLDFGVTHFKASSSDFRDFTDDLISDGVLKEWTDEFSMFDGTEFHKVDPNSDPQMNYTGIKGMNKIAHKLSRWIDFKSQEQAGGLTYIGPDRSRKRSWMINLTDVSVFECDAVIIATPAVEAYGILQTAQNVTATRRIIRHIDEVQYNGCISLAVTYEHDTPEWEGIECEGSAIRWISNESSKYEAQKAGLVIHSTPDFFRKHARTDDETVEELLLEEASNIIDSWVLQSKSVSLQHWKYFEARNPMNEYFMELEMDEAPLALIGDYFNGNSLENAFESGYNLAEYWINKYSKVTA